MAGRHGEERQRERESKLACRNLLGKQSLPVLRVEGKSVELCTEAKPCGNGVG